jgi:hypothetical protein
MRWAVCRTRTATPTLLFELISRRYEHKSTVITTNRAFKEWAMFSMRPARSPLIDRLVHRCGGLHRGRVLPVSLRRAPSTRRRCVALRAPNPLSHDWPTRCISAPHRTPCCRHTDHTAQSGRRASRLGFERSSTRCAERLGPPASRSSRSSRSCASSTHHGESAAKQDR